MLKFASITASALILASTLSIAPAGAAPFGPVKPGLSSDSGIVKVRDGCGYRRFRGRFGRCHWL